MSISRPVSHLKSPLVVAFSPTVVLKVLLAFGPCRKFRCAYPGIAIAIIV